jgi:CDGSH-type Zn-finger protein
MKNKPYAVKLEKGKTYAWCQCAGSKNQPFCDGSHKKLNEKENNVIESLVGANMISSKDEGQKLIAQNDKKPILFKSEKDIEVSLCGCKQSDNAPYCNGTHLTF